MTTTHRLIRAATAAACLLAMQVAKADYAIQEITIPGATNVSVHALNDLGTAAGNASFNGVNQVFVLNDGVATFLSGLPSDLTGMSVRGISNDGTLLVTNFAATADGLPVNRSFIGHDGSFTPFVIEGSSNVTLNGISSDARYVAGFYGADGQSSVHSFIYDLTGGTGLHLLPGAGFVSDVNANGQVVGSRVVKTASGFAQSAFVYDLNSGQFQDYLSAPQQQTLFRAINDQGVVAGEAQDQTSFSGPGFAGLPGSTENLQMPGATQTRAWDVNNSGLVIGIYETDFADGTATIGSFFASPVPEPSSVALTLAGLLVVGLRVARRRQDA